MNKCFKRIMLGMIALSFSQLVWADNVPNFQETLRAAEQGVVAAQYNLGQMYRNGQGVRKDYAEAVKWYRKAAEQGFSPAQNRLGEMYEEGQGVPKNPKVAKEWHKKACANGFQDGCNDYRQLNNEGH